MKLKINLAAPVLHKESDFKYSVSIWEVSGKVMPDCNCGSLAKPFDIYIHYPKMDGNKQEIYQLTKNKLEQDGETV